MDKPFIVKEFDNIICNEDYKNDARFKFMDPKHFSLLESFIHDFSDEKSADVLEFLKIGYKRNVGNCITIKNYVGLIQMRDGFQIEILPKVFLDEGENIENTKNIFLKMLCSMKDFPGKIFNSANLRISKMSLYEIFINMYLQEVEKLVKRGIKSAYIYNESNSNYFKGKLLIDKHLKENISHKERFYVRYDVYSQNRAENRIIKSTLLKLQQITSSAENSKVIKQLLLDFELVDSSFNYQKDFSKVALDRTTKEYENLMSWSKIFLQNKSFTTFSGSSNSRALLFPMEAVFESYVSKNIKKKFSGEGWHVSLQDKKYHLFDEPRKFALRPDIVLKNGNRTIIMDTKWKSLLDNSSCNYGISQADMYQMYAYSKKYNTADVWLLYPVNDDMRDHTEISYKSIIDDNVSVKVYFVDLANIEESIENLCQLSAKD